MVLERPSRHSREPSSFATFLKKDGWKARNAKAEIDRLQARQTTAEKKVDRLKGLLRYFMESRTLRAMKGRLNTISLRKNCQDSLIVERPEVIPPEYWRVSVMIGLLDWQELLNHLPEQHSLRVRLTADADGSVRRDPDNAKLRSALASGTQIQGAELRRGQHVRLT